MRKTPLLAGAVTLACLQALGADSSGLDAYQIDRWFSYNFHGLRIRPQLDVSTTFTDNVFFAPDDDSLEYISPNSPRYILSQTSTGYEFAPQQGDPLQPYNGLVQQYGLVNGEVVALFPTPVPAANLPLNPPAPVGSLRGFSTNVLSFQPRTADVIGTVSPGIKLQYGEDEGNFANIEYNNVNTRYFDQGIVPAMMHQMRAQVRYERSRLRFEGTQTANYLSSFLGGGANQGQRLVDRWVGSTDAKLTYDSTAKTDVYGSAQYNFTDYQSAIALYSVNSWRGNLGATYKPTERLFIFTEGHYGQTALKANTTNQFGAPYSQIYGGFVGIRGKFTSKIEGSIRGGYEIREFPNVAGDSSYAIPAADVTISYAPLDRTLLSLSYTRRTDVSAQVARQPVAFDVVKLSARQVFGRTAAWMATGDISYSRGDFDTLELPGNAFDPVAGSNVRIFSSRNVNYERTETVMTFSTGINYSPRRWLRAGLSYEYENYANSFADAGLRGFFLPSYDAHRVMLGVQIGY